MVTGNFNQWYLSRVLEEFRDIKTSTSGPTRTIDWTFTNYEKVQEAGVVGPLQADGDDGHVRSSNHNIIDVTAEIPRKERYKWLSYSYQFNNKESAEKFVKWIVSND